MTQPAAEDAVDRAWSRAAVERLRAARQAVIAARHESRLRQGAGARVEFHTRMTDIHRGIEQRHLAAAKIHETYARHLEARRELCLDAVAPVFMAAVAETTGSDSAVVTLFGSQQTQALVAASDELAETAHDLEATFGEGPTYDAVAERRLVTVQAAAIGQRWPLFGAAMLRAGVHSIAAAPMNLAAQCLGALTVFHPDPVPHRTEVSIDQVADALTHTLLAETITTAGTELLRLPLFDDADHQPVVNQAAGVVAVEFGCAIPDALALIQAHAFANGERIEAVAARVVAGLLRLGNTE